MAFLFMNPNGGDQKRPETNSKGIFIAQAPCSLAWLGHHPRLGSWTQNLLRQMRGGRYNKAATLAGFLPF